MKQKPNFLIIGAAKSGTTTLHRVMEKHPDIFLSPKKDFKFFDSDENYNKGWAWYIRFFADYNGQKIMGEANSAYLFSEKAIKRIKSDLGEQVKLLVIIRNPVDRAFSEYLHQKRYGKIDKEFEAYIDKENSILDRNDESLYDKIIDRGIYSKHLENYYSYFDKKNIKVVILEQLQQNPIKEINDIFQFLNLKPIEVEDIKSYNKAYNPKYDWLNRLIVTPNFLARRLIPSFKTRQYIKSKLQVLNSKQTEEKPELPSSKRLALWEMFYKKDKQRLENMMGAKIKEWKIE